MHTLQNLTHGHYISYSQHVTCVCIQSLCGQLRYIESYVCVVGGYGCMCVCVCARARASVCGHVHAHVYKHSVCTSILLTKLSPVGH